MKENNIYFNSSDKYVDKYFFKCLSDLVDFELSQNDYSDIIIACIGTDRATGDALGPIVGHYLSKSSIGHAKVFGTLENPMHAKNIEEIMNNIKSEYKKPFIIAIDACLGKTNHIGMINLGKGSLTPGSGVNKILPPVGDIYITGIVNFSGFMDMMVLQNTRLNLVMKMAEIISKGLAKLLSCNIDGKLEIAICKEGVS